MVPSVTSAARRVRSTIGSIVTSIVRSAYDGGPLASKCLLAKPRGSGKRPLFDGVGSLAACSRARVLPTRVGANGLHAAQELAPHGRYERHLAIEPGGKGGPLPLERGAHAGRVVRGGLDGVPAPVSASHGQAAGFGLRDRLATHAEDVRELLIGRHESLPGHVHAPPFRCLTLGQCRAPMPRIAAGGRPS